MGRLVFTIVAKPKQAVLKLTRVAVDIHRSHIVASNHALDLDAQDLGEHRGNGRYEPLSAIRNLRRFGTARILCAGR